MPFDETEFISLVNYLNSIHLTPPPNNTDLAIGQWLMSTVNRRHFWRWQDRKHHKLKQYIYLVTYTLKPEAVEKADKAELYVKDQIHRESLGILQYYYVRELTKAGVPHWHVALVTSKPFKKNRVQYYEKIFGRVDIDKTKGQTIQEALNYMSKEGQPICLME